MEGGRQPTTDLERRSVTSSDVTAHGRGGAAKLPDCIASRRRDRGQRERHLAGVRGRETLAPPIAGEPSGSDSFRPLASRPALVSRHRDGSQMELITPPQ